MAQADFKDWFVIILIAGLWVTSTVFLFKHPSVANFATWAGLAGTTYGAFHWLIIRDDKIKDA